MSQIKQQIAFLFELICELSGTYKSNTVVGSCLYEEELLDIHQYWWTVVDFILY